MGSGACDASRAAIAELSLLVTYRDRPQHLACQLAWWQQATGWEDVELLLVEVSAALSPGLGDRLAALPRSRYLHVPWAGTFQPRSLPKGESLRGDCKAPAIQIHPWGCSNPLSSPLER